MDTCTVNIEGSKRRRVACLDTAANNKSAKIDELPDPALVTIATYLPRTSRLLLAAALTSPASSWEKYNYEIELSEASKIVVSAKNPTPRPDHSHEERHDYIDIDLSELTDADVGSILVCSDAVHKVKSLKLRSCHKVTGQGLEPIRGSTVLEQIILKGDPNEDPDSVISEEVIIPILDSIIASPRSSLKHLNLPMEMLPRFQRSQLMDSFLSRYNRMMNRMQSTCQDCDTIIQSLYIDPWIDGTFSCDVWPGSQKYTCYICMKNFCPTHHPKSCNSCGDVVCSGCGKMTDCANNNCNGVYCKLCSVSVLTKCEDCQRFFCDDPSMSYICTTRGCDCCERVRCGECSGVRTCACGDSICTQCAQNSNNHLEFCLSCYHTYCTKKCLSASIKGWSNNCSDCLKRFLPIMLEENTALHVEITTLHGENTTLKARVAELEKQLKK